MKKESFLNKSNLRELKYKLFSYIGVFKPKITVITPTRHRPDSLYRTILSVQNQTFRDFEHIVVADRCQYAKKVTELFSDKRIKFYESNVGLVNQGGVGKNLGIKNSNSEYICYCDDDNILLPNHLEKLYKAIKKNDSDIVYAKTIEISILHSRGSMTRLLTHNMYDIDSFDPKDISHHNSDAICMLHKKYINNIMVQWEPYQYIKPKNEDAELMERLSKCSSKIKYINDLTSIYYARSASTRPDTEYDEKLVALSKNPQRIFVFPRWTDIKYTRLPS